LYAMYERCSWKKPGFGLYLLLLCKRIFFSRLDSTYARTEEDTESQNQHLSMDASCLRTRKLQTLKTRIGEGLPVRTSTRVCKAARFWPVKRLVRSQLPQRRGPLLSLFLMFECRRDMSTVPFSLSWSSPPCRKYSRFKFLYNSKPAISVRVGLSLCSFLFHTIGKLLME
jgi:hypothetical protein